MGSPYLKICDAVFNWPQYKTGGVALDCDVQVFSLSKLTGHAGPRLGWALVHKRHSSLYTAAAQYIHDVTLGISVDTQARGVALLRHLVSPSSNFFNFTKGALAQRWAAFGKVANDCGELELLNAQFEGPTAWFRVPPGKDALALLLE